MSARSRSRRMSLGGGAQRRIVLGDKSGRVNTTSTFSNNTCNDDMSSGHGGADATTAYTPSKPSRYGIGGSASSSTTSSRRRQSFGGEVLSVNSSTSAPPVPSALGETPARERRRGILEAYRQRQAAAVVAATSSSGNNGHDDDPAAHTIDSRKRTRGDGPPLPPSSYAAAGASSSTSNKILKSSTGQDPPNSSTSFSSSILFYGDDDDDEYNDQHTTTSASFRPHPSSFRGGTPSSSRSNRRATMGGASLAADSASSSRRKSFLLGRNVMHHSEDLSQDKPLSQLTQEHDLENHSIATTHLEDAGIISQIERMKQRVEQLEKEKMDLSMAKAPLEARFRQKEDTWQKEKSSLIDQIEVSKASLREADEKYRDLQVQYEQAFEEVSHLRLEVLKASSSSRVASQSGGATATSMGTNSSLWNRQLQNDRDLAETKEQLRAAEEEIGAIRLAKVSLEKELHATRIELNCLERNYDELKEEFDEMAKHTSENNEAEIKLQVLSEEHIATTAALNAVYSELDVTKARSDAAMKDMEEGHKKEIEQLQFDLSVIKTRAGKMQVDMDASRDATDTDVEDEAVLRARIEDRDKRIAKLEAELLHGEQLRRQMHNTIQELRGNIRVYVRTRPFLPGDKQNDESPVDVSPDGEALSILDRRSGAPLSFKFDKVFPPSAGQELVFDEVSDFVQSALDGYHVCLFSYGQTGSGKTHTMQGCGNGPMRGIIPRAVEKILDQARALNQHKWKFTVTASFLEIYNENLKDLLTSMLQAGNNKSSTKTNDKLAIKRNRDGKSFVDGLTQIPIDVQDSIVGMEQLQKLMSVAARSRSVASTRMNSQSSRSHSVFMLQLNGYNDETGAIVSGALNLCDLAGSERLDRSGAGADAQRLKETQSINKSLSCLGDVFNALATGASHVPYRNSKLTYLLQDCLSGDGKALMFVNLSPTTASCGESVCSLRFAQRVNKVELGKATKHIEYASGR